LERIGKISQIAAQFVAVGGLTRLPVDPRVRSQLLVMQNVTTMSRLTGFLARLGRKIP